MRIALLQLNPRIGDLPGNASKIVDGIERAHAAGAELVVLPELAVCGYPPLDLLTQRGFAEACREALLQISKLAAKTGVSVLIGGPERSECGQFLYNSAWLLKDSNALSAFKKQLLPTYDVFDERRWFAPGPSEQRPLSFREGQASSLSLGVHICEDAWNDQTFWTYPRYPGQNPPEALVGAGARVLVNLSASPWCSGRSAMRRDMMAATARRLQRPVVLVNQIGANDALIFDGSSFVLDAQGAIVLQLPSFEEALGIVDLDESGTLHAVSVSATGDFSADAALARALELGVRDYVRKSGFQKVVLGLSGGVDSALVLTIAVNALGADAVLAIGMPSQFSSEGSVRDARALCEALGVEFRLAPIQDSVNPLTLALHRVTGDQRFSVAEENLQARVRGLLLMGVSNKENKLLLATGNKPELAVGYSTLYGDMCGALEVIGDLYKHQVYALCRFYQSEGAAIPEDILTKAPSAELRPNQKDSDSLPDYDWLDQVVAAYVEEALSITELEERFGTESSTEVRRVVRMIDTAEYKRYQAPPILRVSSRAFGAGRVRPLAQGYRLDRM